MKFQNHIYSPLTLLFLLILSLANGQEDKSFTVKHAV